MIRYLIIAALILSCGREGKDLKREDVPLLIGLYSGVTKKDFLKIEYPYLYFDNLKILPVYKGKIKMDFFVNQKPIFGNNYYSNQLNLMLYVHKDILTDNNILTLKASDTLEENILVVYEKSIFDGDKYLGFDIVDCIEVSKDSWKEYQLELPFSYPFVSKKPLVQFRLTYPK